jgi:hypothetical protein
MIKSNTMANKAGRQVREGKLMKGLAAAEEGEEWIDNRFVVMHKDGKLKVQVEVSWSRLHLIDIELGYIGVVANRVGGGLWHLCAPLL